MWGIGRSCKGVRLITGAACGLNEMECAPRVVTGTAARGEAFATKDLGATKVMVHTKRFEGLPLPEVDEVMEEETSQEVGSSWEAEVLRRIAPRLAEIRRRAAHDEEVLGWEAAGVRRLVEVTGGEI